MYDTPFIKWVFTCPCPEAEPANRPAVAARRTHTLEDKLKTMIEFPLQNCCLWISFESDTCGDLYVHLRFGLRSSVFADSPTSVHYNSPKGQVDTVAEESGAGSNCKGESSGIRLVRVAVAEPGNPTPIPSIQPPYILYEYHVCSSNIWTSLRL